MVTANILSNCVNQFKDFVEKQNKRATKLGCEPITVNYSEPFVKLVKLENGTHVNRMFVTVSVDESAIKLNGWSVYGRVDEFDGSVIVSGKSDMSKYRNYNMSNCDHCKINRQRKHLVVLEKDGKEMVVGTSCLTDFTGHVNAAQYIAMLSWVTNLQDTVDELDIGENSGHRGEYYYELQRVLQTAAAVIRQVGYVSSSTAEETGKPSTKYNVISCLNDTKVAITITEADIQKTNNAMQWFSETEHQNNDYFYNMSILLNKEYITARYIGYVCSLFAIYSKSKQITANAAASQFIGNVGDKKVSMTVTCTKEIVVEGAYGIGHMYLFTSGDNIVMYKTNSVRFEEGQQYNILATIKEHSVYRGVNQTVITRAKII